MQGTRVLALVRGDPRAAEQLGLQATTTEARTPRAHAPQWEAGVPQQSSPRSPQLEKARA